MTHEHPYDYAAHGRTVEEQLARRVTTVLVVSAVVAAILAYFLVQALR